MAKTILLVDDDTHILETAQDILEASGYDVQSAETGSAALEQLSKAPIHLMIVDYNLLDMTGIELALKAKAVQPALIIFLMTGETSVDLGAAQPIIHSVLTKPVNPADLLILIKQVS